MRDWKCSDRGDCCRTLGRITMTQSEADILRTRVAKARGPLVFVDGEDGLTTLVGAPCPFYDKGCTIYDARPYNCRRFMCFRERDEPFNPQAIANTVILVRDIRRQYALNQRKAQRWADAHGWSDDATRA